MSAFVQPFMYLDFMLRFLFSFLMLLTSVSAFAQTPTGEVRGLVLDESTGEVAMFANVSLLRDGQVFKSTASDIDGLFTFKEVVAGKYTLKITLLGYEDYQEEIVVNGGVTTTQNFLLKAKVTDLPTTPFYYDRYLKPIKVDPKSAITHTNLNDSAIKEANYGQDFPYLLATTPSTVTYSDAGAGIGYTGIRIRGVDPTRVNVTINGIPLNDGESQGVFWVDLPNFASSANSVQIQRGVGTSTNGAGDFGGSINISTQQLLAKPVFSVTSMVGSYNSYKNSINLNTGIMDNGWGFNIRASKITSDGYIDRASSDLKSGYMSATKVNSKSRFSLIMMTGQEETYQSWNGVPEDSLETNRTMNEYTYDNQVDHYQQNHYMALYDRVLSPHIRLNTGLHYTKGYGYYEQYKEQDDMSTYGINPIVLYVDDSTNVTVTKSDIIRRRWLDNDFYGGIASVSYSNNNKDKPREVHLGGGYQIYDGLHYGEVIWAQYANNTNIRDRYYENNAKKTDYNVYLKSNYSVTANLMLFGDLQIRNIDYNFFGLNEAGTYEQQDVNFSFFNPKGGVVYTINKNSYAFGSYSQGNREPVRSDLVDFRPSRRGKAEKLHDFELGYRRQTNKYSFEATLYNMQYKGQLVPTGGLNDVGALVRINVDNSYRRGLELAGSVNIKKWLQWTGNITFSANKIEKYKEVIDDWDVGGSDTFTYDNTNIALSPDVIASSMFRFIPMKNLNVDVITKYVGDQYLDNTTSESRKIDAYLVNNVRIAYTFNNVKDLFKSGSIGLLANNVLNELYSSNGYTYSGIYDGGDGRQRYDYNYYYPQAKANFMLQLKLNF